MRANEHLRCMSFANKSQFRVRDPLYRLNHTAMRRARLPIPGHHKHNTESWFAGALFVRSVVLLVRSSTLVRRPAVAKSSVGIKTAFDEINNNCTLVSATASFVPIRLLPHSVERLCSAHFLLFLFLFLLFARGTSEFYAAFNDSAGSPQRRRQATNLALARPEKFRSVAVKWIWALDCGYITRRRVRWLA